MNTCIFVIIFCCIFASLYVVNVQILRKRKMCVLLKILLHDYSGNGSISAKIPVSIKVYGKKGRLLKPTKSARSMAFYQGAQNEQERRFVCYRSLVYFVMEMQ